IGNIYFESDDIFGLGEADYKEDLSNLRDSSKDNLATKETNSKLLNHALNQNDSSDETSTTSTQNTGSASNVTSNQGVNPSGGVAPSVQSTVSNVQNTNMSTQQNNVVQPVSQVQQPVQQPVQQVQQPISPFPQVGGNNVNQGVVQQQSQINA